MDAVKVKIEHCCDDEQHTEHLCYLLSQGLQLDDPEAYVALVQEARFRCGPCGRTAGSNKNLCVPTRL